MKVSTLLTGSYPLIAYLFIGTLLFKIIFMVENCHQSLTLRDTIPTEIHHGAPLSNVQMIEAGNDWHMTFLPQADVILITCALITFLAYIGSPLNNSGEKFALRHGETFQTRQFARLIKKKSDKQTVTIQQQQNAIDVLAGLLEGNFKVPVIAEADVTNPLPELLHRVQDQFKFITEKEKRESWVQSSMYDLERMLKDEHDQQTLNQEIIRLLSKSVNAGVGVLYDWSDQGYFEQLSIYGFFDNLNSRRRIHAGEGQLGEMSVQRAPIFLTDLPKGFIIIQSGLGSATATDVAMFPLLFKGEIYGAIELALFRPLSSNEISWMQRASESIAAHFFNYKVNRDAKEQLENLTRRQANELVEVHRLQQSTYEKLEAKLKEVEDERVKNEAILNGCVDGVVTFNHLGVIEFCNGAAEEILVCKRAEVIKLGIQELLPVRIREEQGVWKPFYVTSSGEKEISVRTEATLGTSTGQTVDALITCIKVNHKGGMIFTLFIQKISVDLF